MTGLEIKINDKVIRAGLEDTGTVNAFVFPYPDHLNIYVGGRSAKEFKRIKWFEEKIPFAATTNIDIRIAEIPNASTPICETPDDRQKLLAEYYRLKEELISEGLL